MAHSDKDSSRVLQRVHSEHKGFFLKIECFLKEVMLKTELVKNDQKAVN